MKSPGTIDDRGRLWMVCPYCDDTVGHMVFNPDTWTLHCFRCGVTAYAPLDMGDTLRAAPRRHGGTKDVGPQEQLSRVLDQLLPGPGLARPSSLARYHVTDRFGQLWDAFLSRETDGEITGVHLRSSGDLKRARTIGHRALGYVGTNLGDRGLARPLRIVEGPYDVTAAEFDVCVFGVPTSRQVKRLAGHLVILCPDGDVWPRPDLLERWVGPWLADPNIVVIAIERLPDSLDPDEVPVEERERMPNDVLAKLRHHYRGTSRSW